LTDIGKAKIANATALGTVVQLTHIAVGDGNGVEIVPDETDNILTNEVWRAALNSIDVDLVNPDWIVAEGYIPSTDGGFTVREVGLFDVAGDMIAIGSYPDTYKPTLASGSAKDLYIKVIIEVSNAGTVELKIDPAVVLASRGFTDATYLKKDGAQTKTGTLTLESSPIIPNPTADQHPASKIYVDSRTPTGLIAMWSGLVTAIPTGWFLCNGANGTPDLRGRFVYGASINGDVGVTGGSADAVVVSHTHTGPSHTHSTPNHSHTASSNTTGDHTHTIPLYGNLASVTANPASSSAAYSQTRASGTAGAHSHTITVNSGGGGTTGVSGTAATGSTGVSGTGANLPPYMKLAYIMKA